MRNVGKWDRLIRVALGVGVLAFLPRTPWALLGLLPLVTGAIGYCPLYRIFGWSTAPRATATKAT